MCAHGTLSAEATKIKLTRTPPSACWVGRAPVDLFGSLARSLMERCIFANDVMGFHHPVRGVGWYTNVQARLTFCKGRAYICRMAS